MDFLKLACVGYCQLGRILRRVYFQDGAQLSRLAKVMPRATLTFAIRGGVGWCRARPVFRERRY